MFVLEFEKSLFEFEYARPQLAPLFALPPTFSSSTMYRLFGQNPVSLEAAWDFSLSSALCAWSSET